MIRSEPIQRPPKKGRPRIEERAQTNEARKPWVALGMSRRTWYSRQKEAREAKPINGG
jgi:hypothetical protein